MSGPLLRVAIVAVGLPVAINASFARNPPLGILANGAILGSLYGLVGIGLVLVFRASRIINFAQAGLGAAPAIAALMFYRQHDVPYLVAVLFLLVAAPAFGALVDLLIIRRFARSPRLILAVATIGVAQLLAFVELFTPRWLSGADDPPQDFDTPLSKFRISIGGVLFSGDHFVTLAVVIICLLGLLVFMRFTAIGVSMRAAADNEPRASMLGIPVGRISTVVWMIAALLSAIGVFLRVPLVGLPLGGLIGPSILLFALTTAVVARMESLPVAIAVGVILGVLDQALFFVTRNPVISNALLLPIILVALLVQRRNLARADAIDDTAWETVTEFRRIPSRLSMLSEVLWVRRFAVSAVAVIFAAGPFIAGPLRTNFASLLLIYAIVGVSLVLLTGWAGQISLGQYAFSGLGAAVAGALAADAGADFFVAIFAAIAVGGIAAMVVGIPALRVKGFYLAVTTLAFSGTTHSFFLDHRYFAWLLPESDNPVTRPLIYGRLDVSDDRTYYYLCLFMLVLSIACARAVRRSRSGRVMIAARDNPSSAQAYGINLTRTRLAAFAISGGLAGLAGGLLAYLVGSVDAGAFEPTASIQLFAMTVIGGLTSVTGAVAGAVYVVTFQYLLPDYELLASGLGMLLLLLIFPGGIVEMGVKVRDAGLRRLAERADARVPTVPGVRDAEVERDADSPTVLAAARGLKGTVGPT